MVWNTKLTDVQVDRIFELSAPLPDGRRRSARRIAEALGVSKNAVSWQMYRHGLRPKGQSRSTEPRVRKDGTVVRPYTDREDAFILSRRMAGKTYAEIAADVREHLGHYRRPSSVKVRLIMLAGFETAAEEQALAA